MRSNVNAFLKHDFDVFDATLDVLNATGLNFAGVSSVVLLDVRQPSEVAEACVVDAGGRKVLYAPVTLDDSSAMSETFLASHNLSKDQAVVVFCRSGRRAGVAKAALEALGCTAVTNGGTVEDVKLALLAAAKCDSG